MTKTTSVDDEAIFTKVAELRDQTKYEEALALIYQLIPKYPHNTAILATAAYLFWELRKLDEAISLFKSATEVSPKSEEISLCLFNCLWEMGRQVEALDEAKRFLSVSVSKDYLDIIREINQRTTG